jgi:hypothetical protein
VSLDRSEVVQQPKNKLILITEMGIYYGDVLGVRIVRHIHREAEYSEDIEIVWEYKGPYWKELLKAKLQELAEEDLLVQTLHQPSDPSMKLVAIHYIA